MEVIVDRIEEDYLVLELENHKMINVPKNLVPDAIEGDIIEITINYAKRAKKEKELEMLKSKLFIDYQKEE